jgi:hypothetical protein
MSAELGAELWDLRSRAKLVDGAGKLALESEGDLFAVETLGDHVGPL